MKKDYQRKVVMYPSSYKFDGKDVLVTAINIINGIPYYMTK